MKIFIFTVLISLLSGCVSEQETQVHEIVSHKNLWLSSSANKDYKYDLIIHRPTSSEPIHYSVKVTSGSSSLSKIPDLATIEALFTYAFNAIKNPELKLKVSYHNKMGYPISISVTNPEIIDSSSTVKVANFELL